MRSWATARLPSWQRVAHSHGGCRYLEFRSSFPSGVRAILDKRFGTYTNDVLTSGCTHICGNSWIVWPAVFHVNMVLHEQGSRRRVWGITERSEPTQDKWRTIPMEQWKVAVPI